MNKSSFFVMKKAYGGWWFEDIGKEINMNILLGFLAGIVFFGCEALSCIFLLYAAIKGISLFLFISHLAFSILLVKKVMDKIYKKI